MMSEHKTLVKEQIKNYANAVNSGDIESILSFYSEDAVFMPDGVKSLKKNQIGKSRLKLLAKTIFKIEFDDIKTVVNDNFAFVEAIAKTSENDEVNESTVHRTSRDFFIFRQEDGQWRIIRYIFNNFKDSKA